MKKGDVNPSQILTDTVEQRKQKIDLLFQKLEFFHKKVFSKGKKEKDTI